MKFETSTTGPKASKARVPFNRLPNEPLKLTVVKLSSILLSLSIIVFWLVKFWFAKESTEALTSPTKEFKSSELTYL